MKDKNALLVKAAMAGLVGAAIAAVPAHAAAKAKKKGLTMEVAKCYGVNSCKGHGGCAGVGHECAGQNSCKGQGWLYMPEESCKALEGGSLTPVAEKTEKK